MAIVRIPGGLVVPLPPSVSSSPTIGNAMFLGAGGDGTHKVAFIFQVPQNGTLDKFEYLAGSTVGSCTARLSFQDLDASGFPDGTEDQYRALAVTGSAWNTPGVLTSDGTDGGTKRSVTRGQWLACVIGFDSFPGGVGFNVAGQAVTNATATVPASAWVAQFTSSAWTTSFSGANVPILALKYNDGTYAHIHPNVYPMTAIAATTFNSGSTPDEQGLRFQVPFDCELDGLWVRLDADGDVDLVLYDAASSALATISLDKDYRPATSELGGLYRFASAQALTANTTYRLAVKPTTTTSVIIEVATVAASGHLAAWEGGEEWYLTTRSDAGSWTDTTTKRPYIGLVLSGVDTGSGGGGGETAHVFIG